MHVSQRHTNAPLLGPQLCCVCPPVWIVNTPIHTVSTVIFFITHTSLHCCERDVAYSNKMLHTATSITPDLSESPMTPEGKLLHAIFWRKRPSLVSSRSRPVLMLGGELDGQMLWTHSVQYAAQVCRDSSAKPSRLCLMFDHQIVFDV